MRKLLLASSAATLLTAGAAFAQPAVQVAAPGTVAVHLNGYFQYSVGAYGSSAMSGGTGTSAYKLNSVSTAGDFRLLPGFDGQTLNGIWYGGHFELRTAKSNAGAGKNNNTTVSTGGSNNGFSALYVQRAYGYIGTPNYGFARFGQTDSAFSLSQVGVVEGFGDGAQFNADGGANLMLPTGPSLFVYGDTSALYSTDKVVYESPKFETAYGNFSGIVGFEPNSNGMKQGYSPAVDGDYNNWATASSVTCSDSDVSCAKRRRNTVDASLSYADDLEGFANKVSIAYLHGAPLGNMTGSQQYDTLSVFEGGLQTSYAGLTVGGNIKFGQVNNGYTFKPKGARNGLGYILGASYNVGPYTLGVSYFNQQSAGSYTVGSSYARTESQYGIATGADYQLAKPIILFVQYEYGHQHQPKTTNGVTSGGNTQEQVVAVGTTIKW